MTRASLLLRIGLVLVAVLALSTSTGCLLTTRLHDLVNNQTLGWTENKDNRSSHGSVVYGCEVGENRYDLYLIIDPMVGQNRANHVTEWSAAVLYPSDGIGKALAFSKVSDVDDLLYRKSYQDAINECLKREGFTLHTVPYSERLTRDFLPILPDKSEDLVGGHERGRHFVWSGRDMPELTPQMEHDKDWAAPGERIGMALLVDENKNYRALRLARWDGSRWNLDPEVPVADCTAKPLPWYVLGLTRAGYLLSVPLDIVTFPAQLLLGLAGPW